MESLHPVIQLFLYLTLLLLGWWVPALVFYAAGLFCLLSSTRRPKTAIAWGAAFACCLAYTAFDGVWRKFQFDQRAQKYQGLVSLETPPPELRTIMIAGAGHECRQDCVLLLLGGKFDRVVFGYRDLDPALFNYDSARIEAARHRGPNRFAAYRLAAGDGCKRSWDTKIHHELRGRDVTGRCLVETDAYKLEGPRIEYFRGEYTPQNPPWPVSAQHIRAVEANATRDLARVEFADVEFAYPFSLPGFFPHDWRNATGWRFGFFGTRHRYGTEIEPRKMLASVFAIPDDGAPVSLWQQLPDR